MVSFSWPNLKQRGSLLGSERLVEIFRHGISNAEQLDAISAAGLAEDEKRLLNVALTRASKQVFITAVAHEDNQPSRYFEKLAPDDIQVSQTQRSITQPALVAALLCGIHNLLSSPYSYQLTTKHLLTSLLADLR